MRASIYRAIIVLLTPLVSARAQTAMPTWHARQGDLPALVVTPHAIEALVTRITAAGTSLEAIDTVALTNAGGVLLLVTNANGRTVGTNVSIGAARDTLHHYLETRDRLTRIIFNYNDPRVYRNRERLLNQSRVGIMSVSFITSGDHAGAHYNVSGYDSALVDKIADRIEGFGREHESWRTPKLGERLKSAILVSALLLLPIALALRDRRGAWILYPLSAGLFAAGYLFPFASAFAPVIIVNTR